MDTSNLQVGNQFNTSGHIEILGTTMAKDQRNNHRTAYRASQSEAPDIVSQNRENHGRGLANSWVQVIRLNEAGTTAVLQELDAEKQPKALGFLISLKT